MFTALDAGDGGPFFFVTVVFSGVADSFPDPDESLLEDAP